MPLLFLLVLLHLSSLHVPACAAAKDTLPPGHLLAGDDRLVSGNGKFALGFFRSGSEYSSHNHNASNWYLGIWFNKVPKQTPVWVANRDNPATHPNSSYLTFSQDGNLAIINRATSSILWSSQANITINTTTIAVLLNTGNLVLQNASNSSDILWESFDHPADVLLPGAKIGRNKITGLNRRLVSRKNRVDHAPGVYSMEFGLTGGCQLLWNSSIEYWSVVHCARCVRTKEGVRLVPEFTGLGIRSIQPSQ